MNSVFIQRPILSAVIAIIITLLGLITLVRLPMTQFPGIAPPEVNVTIEYPGANAEAVVKAAIVPLERAINGVPGMKYIASYAGNDGVGLVKVIFETGTDVDVAAVNVQNRVNAVIAELPAEVIKSGVKIGKLEHSMLMYLNIVSTDTTLNEKFLYNFADINLMAELKRIYGVGFIDIMGVKEYAMRIWLKPDKMLAYNVSAAEVLQALQEQNVEAAPGKIGENSDKTTETLQYVVRYTGKYFTESQYENIPIRATEGGEILRVKDIASVEFGTTYYDVEARLNGQPTAAFMIKQLPGSNAREVIQNIKSKLAELKAKTFLEGMDYYVSYDVSAFLDASVESVVKTLIEAFILVALVVYIFLQNVRATLIPVLAVPVSLVGTFFFIQFLGFSLNLITLFALVLAIGIVVDDAIVVVEAVHTKMEKSKIGALGATRQAMKEVSGAIIAITLVMSAVFLPVAFMSGPAGIFYRQFSLTMAIAIVISGVTALTLTPALCALLLKDPHAHGAKKGVMNVFFDGFNRWYAGLSGRYQRALGLIANRRLVTFGSLVVLLAATGVLSRRLPTGFIPNEDQGTFYASVTTPAGATLERTKAVVNAIQRAAQQIAAVESVATLAGQNILSDGTGANYGTCIVQLKNWKDRDQTVREVIELLKAKTRHIKDARIEYMPPPAVPGFGNASGFEARLIDRTGSGDLKKMQAVVRQFVADLKAAPGISNAFTIFDASFPQYLLHFDADRAAQKGVTVENAMGSLQTLLGSAYATNFIRFGQMYKVMVQASPEYRAKPEDILSLYVKSSQNEMVPVSAFLTMEKVFGVDQITRFNMYLSAEVTGEPAPGYSSGSAIAAVRKTATEKLPRGYDIEWAGISRDEVNTGPEAIFIFLVCLLFVYLVLCAQYESFLLPVAVVLSLPAGLFGAFFLLTLMGLENNIYAQVAMIMLVGLLGKNGILIVEFAALRMRAGRPPLQAALEGGRERLRPILMTSFAFIAGLLPLVLASGAGAVGNRTIGAAALGGMFFGTVLGVFITPGLFVVFSTLSEKMSGSRKRGAAPYTETI